MKLSENLDIKQIHIQLNALTKNDAINYLVDNFSNHPDVTDVEAMRTSIFDRESIMSTGVGKGVAIPHGKTESVHSILVSAATLKIPLDFSAMDNQPVDLIFLIASKPSMVSLHIKLLSRISRLVNKQTFKDQLLRSESPEQFLKLIETEENQFTD